MFEKMQNSKKQGDLGVSAAIFHFQMNGVAVSIPFGDSQRYDLIADKDGELKRVQVKTSAYMRNGSYEVGVKTCGGNRSGQSVKKLDKNDYDILFVLTSDGSVYEIPADDVESSTCLVLGSKYEKYKGRLGMS